jgi:hypothetical protein
MWIQINRVCKEISILEISVASYYNQKKVHTFHEHNLHFHASSAKMQTAYCLLHSLLYLPRVKHFG